MSVQFSGWEVIDDGASFPGVLLNSAQKPQNRGVYTMYHGTSINCAKLIISSGFKQSSNGMLGKGVYVSRDKRKASNYPLHSKTSDRVVLELRVRVGRVKRIDKDNHPLQYSWNAKGYDTAWVPPNCGMLSVPSGLEEDCVYDPKRVKVVGIAKAPDTATQKDLQQLLDKKSKRGQDGAANLCPQCKRKTQMGTPHIKQQCWACGQNICILMSKHFLYYNYSVLV
uniref:Grass carp reovirus (GCRV)-induced gene 2p n=1 Tax=Sphaeramia orbicularis TaxID=375764 RepID=A0A673CSR3_9TELE